MTLPEKVIRVKHGLRQAARPISRVMALRAMREASLSRSPGYLFQDDDDRCKIRARCSLGRR